MNRNFCILLWLVILGCSRQPGNEAPPSNPPLAAVVIGGVYASPSHVPDDPYWLIWKVLAEKDGDVWYMFYTNRIAATAQYSAPPRLEILGNLTQPGTNWGASLMKKGRFLGGPVLYYLGAQEITAPESNALEISMRSYYETRQKIVDAALRRRTLTKDPTRHSSQQPPATPL